MFERALEVHSQLPDEASVDDTIYAAVEAKLEVAIDQVRIAFLPSRISGLLPGLH